MTSSSIGFRRLGFLLIGTRPSGGLSKSFNGPLPMSTVETWLNMGYLFVTLLFELGPDFAGVLQLNHDPSSVIVFKI